MLHRTIPDLIVYQQQQQHYDAPTQLTQPPTYAYTGTALRSYSQIIMKKHHDLKAPEIIDLCFESKP